MNDNEAEKVLYWLTKEFLREDLSNAEKEKKLIKNISMTEAMELNQFLCHTYFALKHYEEESDKTTNAELMYYIDCFEGRKIFNIEERDEIIRNEFRKKKKL